MLSLQPINLWRYIGIRRTKASSHIKRLFYLSWEDALWDILKNKDIPKGSTVLVPEFFCGDVENNIKNHGYMVVHYPVSKYLTCNEDAFIKRLVKFVPRVVVIFHPVGIHNRLLDKSIWIKYIRPETIIIEDSAHLLINPEKIKIIKKNHFIIDSLRKVVPLQGSNVFGNVKDLNFSAPPIFQSFHYSLRVIFLWLEMIFFWNLSNLFAKNNLSNFFAETAEKLMIKGYDLIGDNKLSARGFFIFGFIQQFIDYKKIGKIKKRQIEVYEEKLGDIIPININYSDKDRSEMRGWPIVLPINRAKTVLKFLRKNGLKIRFELNDSIWSRKQKIIYLPLGPHLNTLKVLSISDLVIKSFEYE